jgi:hypothetical protein
VQSLKSYGFTSIHITDQIAVQRYIFLDLIAILRKGDLIDDGHNVVDAILSQAN